MGNEKPEFSTFSYIAMMALAGVGSGTVYWAFLEWSYYIKTPPFAIEAGSVTAAEWAVTYSLHHWGGSLPGQSTPLPQFLSCILSILEKTAH